MENIYIYADFDFLEQSEEIGVLSYERVRGNDHFAFEFSREWLSRHGDMILSGDVMNLRGTQHRVRETLCLVSSKILSPTDGGGYFWTEGNDWLRSKRGDQ